MKRRISVLVAAALALFAAGVFAGFRTCRAWYPPVDPARVDTVYVQKTADIFSPQPAETTPRPDLPPVAIPAKEARIVHDTVYIRPETQTFQETLAPGVMATAVITGIRPTLDHLQITWPEATVTKTVIKPYKGWMLSATSDFSALASPSVHSFARYGLEASYSTGPLHLAIQAGAATLSTAPGSWSTAPYIGGRLTLDILKR